MTKSKFLNWLKLLAKRRKFRILPSGKIRDTKGRCPICSVANLLHGLNYYTEPTESAEVLKLREYADIICAADNEACDSPKLEKLRKQLVDICS